MCEPLRALVADRNTARGRANARALAEAGVSAFLVNFKLAESVSCLSREVHEETLLQEVEFPTVFTFVLLHDNDRESFWWLQIRESWGGRMPIIFRFTGGLPPDEAGWLRALRSEKDPLNHREIEELIKWVAKGGKEQDRPRILRINRDDPGIANLAALVVLCQAYLAVHIDRETQRPVLPESESGDSDQVSKAIAKMGLPPDWRSAHGVIGKRREVRQCAWWTTIFPHVAADATETFGPIVPPEVTRLIAVLQDEATAEVPSGVVAGAYLALEELP